MMSRKRQYLSQSKVSLWLTPFCCALFVGMTWLVGRVFAIPTAVYWIVVVVTGLAWVGDLLNVILLRHKMRREH